MIHVAARNGLLLALLDGMSGLAERSREITGREARACSQATIRVAHPHLRGARRAVTRLAARSAMLDHLDEIREALTRVLDELAGSELNPLVER